MAKSPKPPFAGATIYPTEEEILKGCTWLRMWVQSIDPTFKQAIETAKEEYGWDDRKLFGAWIGYIIENDLSMQVPQHPFFEPGFTGTSGQATCVTCKDEFTVTYPGQHVCSNACALARDEAARIAAEQAQAASPSFVVSGPVITQGPEATAVALGLTPPPEYFPPTSTEG